MSTVGFPAAGGYTPSLEDAEIRVTGRGARPVPAPVTAEELLEGDYDSRLVRLEGQVLNRKFDELLKQAKENPEFGKKSRDIDLD